MRSTVPMLAIRAPSTSRRGPSTVRQSYSFQPRDTRDSAATNALSIPESNMISQEQSHQDRGRASSDLDLDRFSTLYGPRLRPWIQPQPVLSLVSEPTPYSDIEGMIHSFSDPTLSEAPGCYADGSYFRNPFAWSNMI